MKIGILGTGKTGRLLFELKNNDHEMVGFNSSNPLTLDNGHGLDCIISFLPSEIFNSYITLLIELRVPVVSGATGELDLIAMNKQVESANLTWIWGSNFSLSMVIIKEAFSQLKKLKQLDSKMSFKIHEVHHTQKKDAPSGTANSWNEWLDDSAVINSKRIGDVIGFHELTMDNQFEKMIFSHESLDRKLFAQGALWAAEFLMNEKLEYKIYYFDEIVKEFLEKT